MFPKLPRTDGVFTLLYLTFLLSVPILNGQHRKLSIWGRPGFCAYSMSTANCIHSGAFSSQKNEGGPNSVLNGVQK